MIENYELEEKVYLKLPHIYDFVVYFMRKSFFPR